jgi:hypothetical protein
LEQYDSFALIEATDQQIESLKQEGFKVVVPDDLGSIKVGAHAINTDSLRYDKRGNILSHPSYDYTRDPGPGKHHYLVNYLVHFSNGLEAKCDLKSC